MKKSKFQRESKEIILENLTNEEVLKAIVCWYENGNVTANLKKRWGEKRWQFYQEDPENFLKKGVDPDISVGGIKNNLSLSGAAEYRLGFKTEKITNEEDRKRIEKFPAEATIEGFGNVDAKFYIIFKREDQELTKRKLDEVEREAKNKGLSKKETENKIDETLLKILF